MGWRMVTISWWAIGMALSLAQDMQVSYFLPDRYFDGQIWPTFTPQTVHENRIYSLKITCGDLYPESPPTVQFISKVNLPFVDQTDGQVHVGKLHVLANWNRNSSIETILVEIRRLVIMLLNIFIQSQVFRIKGYSKNLTLTFVLAPDTFSSREMATANNRKLPQPPEGSIFWTSPSLFELTGSKKKWYDNGVYGFRTN